MRMVRLLQNIYTFWVVLVFSFFMILFLPGILIPFLFGNRFSWISYNFLWIWSWLFGLFTGIRFNLQGKEKIQKKKSYVYVSNHTSFLDVPGVRLMIRGEFRPIAKKELLKIPVFGYIVKAATVVVDRSSHESRKKSVDYAKQIIAQGISLLIFAEGTQNRTTELLQPFKDGAFRIAIDTKTPLLPVVIIGAGKLMPPGKLSVRPGTIRIVALDEIPVEGLTLADVAALKEKTFATMKETLEKFA
jgi:1-acyl-sn-glycerol-3-phosphate acyltransferase